jgi:hypothetical protein
MVRGDWVEQLQGIVVPAIGYFDWPNVIAATTGAFVGTVVGAIAAFALERHRRKKEQENSEVVAANLTIFNLQRAWDDLVEYRKDFVTPALKTTAIWYSLEPPAIVRSAEKPPISQLAFLLETDPNLINRISAAWSSFESYEAVVAARGIMHVEHVQSAIERNVTSPDAPEHVLAKACGKRIHGNMLHYTNLITGQIDDIVQELYDAGHALREVLKRRYPKRVIIRWTPIKQESETKSGVVSS